MPAFLVEQPLDLRPDTPRHSATVRATGCLAEQPANSADQSPLRGFGPSPAPGRRICRRRVPVDLVI